MPSALYDAVLGGLTVRQVHACRLAARNQIGVGRFSGGLAPQAIYLDHQEMRATIETHAIAPTLAGLTSLQAGLSIVDSPIALPWSKRARGGSFASGSAHQTISGTHALVVPRMIVARQGTTFASASLEVLFYSADGETAPVAINSGQALGAQAFAGGWQLGPVTIGSTILSDVIGVSIDPGIREEYQSFDGHHYPRFVSIVELAPTIEITFRDLDALNTFVSEAWGEVDSLAVYLRTKVAGGTTLSPATEGHLRFSFAAGVRDLTSVSASDRSSAEATIRVHGTALAYSATSALPGGE